MTRLAAVWIVCVSALTAACAAAQEPVACGECAQGALSCESFDLYAAPGAPVMEPDWEQLLRERVREADRLGLFRDARLRTQENLRRHARNPVDLGLPRARGHSERTVALVEARTVGAMPEAVRAVFAGFERRYVFFDASDPAQLRWVRGLPGLGASVRPVATAGNLQKAAEVLRTPLYADQGGALARRFELASVPSFVRLGFEAGAVVARVEEVPVGDEPAPEDDARTENRTFKDNQP